MKELIERIKADRESVWMHRLYVRILTLLYIFLHHNGRKCPRSRSDKNIITIWHSWETSKLMHFFTSSSSSSSSSS